MSLTWKWGLALSLALITAACGKKQEAPQTAETEATAATSAAAAPEAQPAAPAPAPAAPAEPAASSEVVDERAAAIQAALAEDAIVSDSRGQFAVSAIASSTYSADKKPESRVSYTPNAATGAPDGRVNCRLGAAFGGPSTGTRKVYAVCLTPSEAMTVIG